MTLGEVVLSTEVALDALKYVTSCLGQGWLLRILKSLLAMIHIRNIFINIRSKAVNHITTSAELNRCSGSSLVRGEPDCVLGTREPAVESSVPNLLLKSWRTIL